MLEVKKAHHQYEVLAQKASGDAWECLGCALGKSWDINYEIKHITMVFPYNIVGFVSFIGEVLVGEIERVSLDLDKGDEHVDHVKG